MRPDQKIKCTFFVFLFAKIMAMKNNDNKMCLATLPLLYTNDWTLIQVNSMQNMMDSNTQPINQCNTS